MNRHVTVSNSLSVVRRKCKVKDKCARPPREVTSKTVCQTFIDTFYNRTKQFSGRDETSTSQIVHMSRCTAGDLNKYEGELASSDKKPSFVEIGQLLQML